jgi:hypothetical protein
MSSKPFFMRFVERQDKQAEAAEAVRTNVKAGADDGKGKTRKEWEKQPETMKYPSDSDEYWPEW